MAQFHNRSNLKNKAPFYFKTDKKIKHNSHFKAKKQVAQKTGRFNDTT
jgi:hypothetical protein